MLDVGNGRKTSTMLELRGTNEWRAYKNNGDGEYTSVSARSLDSPISTPLTIVLGNYLPVTSVTPRVTFSERKRQCVNCHYWIRSSKHVQGPAFQSASRLSSPNQNVYWMADSRVSVEENQSGMVRNSEENQAVQRNDRPIMSEVSESSPHVCVSMCVSPREL